MVDEQVGDAAAIAGNAYVAGSLTVLDGAQLTLTEGTQLVFVKGEDGVLNVQGALIAQGARFTTDGTAPGSWVGVRIIGGSAILSDCTIERARQGVAFNGASRAVTLQSCSVLDNLVGVHLFSGLLYMDDNLFAGNTWYGVKIEAGVAQATQNRFRDNGQIYYDPDLTLMSVQDLNTIEGNWRNVVQ